MGKKDRLDQLLDAGYASIEFENRMAAPVIERCLPYVSGKAVLTLGYAGDGWPRRLAALGYRVTIVEGAKRHYEKACRDFADRPIDVHYSTFEDFEPPRRFDTVIVGSVIEFFDDPLVLLAACKRFVGNAGRVIVTTPNALSIHRRLGAILGMEDSPRSVNAAGHASDTCHSFDPHSLRAVLSSGGLKCRVMFGSQLKFLSAPQMKDWDDRLLDGLEILSQELPMELCKELVAICDVAG